MDCGEHTGSKRYEDFRKIVKALHCPIRWMIIECLREPKSTKEILDCLLARDEKFTSTGLYYHLSELRGAGIIEIAGYREGQGAPQKIWRLKVKKIEIPLVEDYERD